MKLFYHDQNPLCCTSGWWEVGVTRMDFQWLVPYFISTSMIVLCQQMDRHHADNPFSYFFQIKYTCLDASCRFLLFLLLLNIQQYAFIFFCRTQKGVKTILDPIEFHCFAKHTYTHTHFSKYLNLCFTRRKTQSIFGWTVHLKQCFSTIFDTMAFHCPKHYWIHMSGISAVIIKMQPQKLFLLLLTETGSVDAFN